MSYRIGVDIGGTFTDFALFDDSNGDVLTYKQLTSSADPSIAVIEGIGAVIAQAGLAMDQIDVIVHGTTLVTNAIIERKDKRTAMLVTQGFADVLDIGYERRYDLFDLHLQFPEPAVPRYLRVEVEGRLRHDGTEELGLNLDAALSNLRTAVEANEVQSIAVCFLHSTVNDCHEQAALAWLAEHFPQLSVSLSSAFPYPREYERWTTACLNAYVQPVVDRYMSRLESTLSTLGFRGRFIIMSSSGGTLTTDIARRFPIRLLESGPAAGALMSAVHGRSLNEMQVLSFDMGGTTAKGCLIRDGQPLKRYEFEVARVHEFKKGSGLPTKIPVIDMIEIGSGGGSLAELDERGTLRVGPRSASSDPGPACYGRGGLQPTLTDANLLLGYLDSGSFLGGQMALDANAAQRVMQAPIAEPLGIDHIMAAWGIHEVINEDVARAFRVHASERGFDYRKSSMIVFGGSGPMHGSRVARKLRIPRVICPWGAGVMSAFGLLSSPFAFEVVRSRRVCLGDLGAADLANELANIGREASDFLENSDVLPETISLHYRLDMRYEGQGYEVEVAIPPDLALEQIHAALSPLFAAAYSAVFGLSLDERTIEIVSWKAEAQGPKPGGNATYHLKDNAAASSPLKGRRPAYFPEAGGLINCPVYDRYALPAGFQLDGPALVEERESTCLVTPYDVATIDDHMNLVINVGVLQ